MLGGTWSVSTFEGVGKTLLLGQEKIPQINPVLIYIIYVASKFGTYIVYMCCLRSVQPDMVSGRYLTEIFASRSKEFASFVSQLHVVFSGTLWSVIVPPPPLRAVWSQCGAAAR